MTDPRDLDTLIAIAKQQEKEMSSSESAQTSVIHILAEAGGALPIQDLLSRYGVSKQTLSSLLDPDLSSDKRKKVRAKLGTVDGEAIVYLTSSGVQAAGRSVRGFSVHPTSQSLAHAMAPSRLASWIEGCNPRLRSEGVELQLSWGPSCRAFSDRVVSLAWARLKTVADSSGSIGLLTGGLFPDAILTEYRTVDDLGAAHFTKSWGEPPKGLDDLAETTIAIEYQVATRTNGGDPLRYKCDAWSAAINVLNAAHKVIWIVEPKAAKILSSLGVGDIYRRPGHVMVPAFEVGFGGDHFEVSGQKWWLSR